MNECAVIELPDGTLMLNSRSYRGKACRGISLSKDGGATWEPTTDDPALVESVCQASLDPPTSGGTVPFLQSSRSQGPQSPDRATFGRRRKDMAHLAAGVRRQRRLLGTRGTPWRRHRPALRTGQLQAARLRPLPAGVGEGRGEVNQLDLERPSDSTQSREGAPRRREDRRNDGRSQITPAEVPAESRETHSHPASSRLCASVPLCSFFCPCHLRSRRRARSLPRRSCSRPEDAWLVTINQTADTASLVRTATARCSTKSLSAIIPSASPSRRTARRSSSAATTRARSRCWKSTARS